MATGRKVGETLIFGFGLAFSLLGAGLIMVVGETTLINLPLYIFILLMIGGGVGFAMKGWLKKLVRPSIPEWYLIVGVTIGFVCIAGGGVLAVNVMFAERTAFEEEEVLIEKKIVKTRHETRRSGRRSYSTGREYHVYYLQLLLPDGRKREIHPDYELYKKGMEGDTAYINIERGALGMRVIDERSLRLKHPRNKKKTRSYRQMRRNVCR